MLQLPLVTDQFKSRIFRILIQVVVLLFLTMNLFSQLGFTEIDLGELSTSTNLYVSSEWVDYDKVKAVKIRDYRPEMDDYQEYIYK